MDRTTKEEKMKEDEKTSEELLALLKESAKREHAQLEKELGSQWNPSRNKNILKRFQDIYENIQLLAALHVGEELKLRKLQMQLETVNEMVQKVAQKVDVDLSDLRGKVESFQKTIEMPAFAEVAEFVKALKVDIKKGEEAQGNYVD